ncbi:hypothetical protein BASA81_001722 [Batrachochytrium salamandrivorans]|nr:hypothetical protein BASA81_001722 [Batrachochytrium salamandrivorans]
MGEWSQTEFDVLFTFSEDPCYCNGNGNYSACLVSGFCECHEGFSGLADFSNGRFSCHISDPAIIALWSVLVFFVLASTLISLPLIREMLTKFFKVKAKLKAKGKTYTMTTHRGLIVVLLCHFVVHPLLVVTALLRIFKRDERIGMTWPITVVWTLVNTTFAITTHRYTTAIATAMLRAEESTQKYIAMGRWFGRGIMFSEAALTVFAYPQLIWVGQDSKLAARVCVTLYYLGSFAVMAILGAWTRWVIRQLQLVFNEYEEHNDVQTRIVRALKQNFSAYQFQAVVFLIALAIPVLWTTHDYLQPVLFLTIPYYSFRATKSVYVPNNKTNNNYKHQQVGTVMATNNAATQLKDSDNW